MQNVSIHKASHLPEAVKSAVEQLLGRRLPRTRRSALSLSRRSTFRLQRTGPRWLEASKPS